MGVRFSPIIHASPWPCQLGVCALSFTSSMVLMLKSGTWSLVVLSFLSGLICLSLWCKDLIFEAMSGEYCFQMMDNLKLSFSLLILSEGMLFVSLLWGLLHLALSPSVWVGHTWPPVGVVVISSSGVPLLNTALLVSSGVVITWGHHLLLSGWGKSSVGVLGLSMSLGGLLLLNQMMELHEASFTISDSVYGSVLLVLTGLHGCHVLLGLCLLMVSVSLLVCGSFTCLAHLSLELAIWYWHLVDCVWLVVYGVVYWWGG